jgi:hypothetical protein
MKDLQAVVSMPKPPKSTEPQEPDKDPSIVSLPKAVSYLAKKGINISLGRLRRLVMTGEIPSFKSGNRYYVSISVLLWYFTDPSSPLWTKKTHLAVTAGAGVTEGTAG